MKSTIRLASGILILLLASCQVKVLTTDSEKMHLNGDVQFVYEQTFALIPINDTLRTFTKTIDFIESDYWKLNSKGYIIEHGHQIPYEDSLLTIEKYSHEYPYSLKQLINRFSGIDTVNVFENVVVNSDTIFKKIYFSDSTLYRSEISVIDKKGREIENISVRPPLPKVITHYYSNGLEKQKTFIEPGFWYGLTETIYKYKDSNLTTESDFYENGKITEYSYEYTFDTNRNWISQTEYINNEPCTIKIRILKYYNE